MPDRVIPEVPVPQWVLSVLSLPKSPFGLSLRCSCEARAGHVAPASVGGNIEAYWPDNPNTTALTGIPSPYMRDPYVISWFFGIQREIRRNLVIDVVIDVNYVGTGGWKLIRAEDWSRFTGDRSGAESPTGERAGDTNWNRINQTYGALRFWENSVTSFSGGP